MGKVEPNKEMYQWPSELKTRQSRNGHENELTYGPVKCGQ